MLAISLREYYMVEVYLIKLLKIAQNIFLIAIILGSLFLLVSFNAWAESPPGKLVSVNGRNMHIYCTGNKSPSVILDSGAGGFSLEWQYIQSALSQHVRVCSYDRAGYGWSDMGTLPRTTKKIAFELYDLLQEAGVHKPYVMVGHSFGGFTAQYFAQQFHDHVVGLVLIDSSHEAQVYRLPENEHNVTRNSLDQQRNNMVIRPIMHENFPAEYAALAYALMNQGKSLLTWREEMVSYALSSRQLRDMHQQSIDDIPVFVLTRGKRVWPHTQYGDAMESMWLKLQQELNNLSANSKHIVAENSQHSIHLDQPDLVINAINDILSLTMKDAEYAD